MRAQLCYMIYEDTSQQGTQSLSKRKSWKQGVTDLEFWKKKKESPPHTKKQCVQSWEGKYCTKCQPLQELICFKFSSLPKFGRTTKKTKLIMCCHHKKLFIFN